MGSPKLEGIVKCRGLKLERPLNTQLVRYKYRTVQASQVIYGDKSYFANAQTFIIYSYPEQTHEACAKHYRQLLPVFSSLHPTDKSFIVYFVEMMCWEELEKRHTNVKPGGCRRVRTLISMQTLSPTTPSSLFVFQWLTSRLARSAKQRLYFRLFHLPRNDRGHHFVFYPNNVNVNSVGGCCLH